MKTKIAYIAVALDDAILAEPGAKEDFMAETLRDILAQRFGMVDWRYVNPSQPFIDGPEVTDDYDGIAAEDRHGQDVFEDALRDIEDKDEHIRHLVIADQLNALLDHALALPDDTRPEVMALLQRARYAHAGSVVPAPREEVLRVLWMFREFYTFYVTQTKIGGNHHPLWTQIANALGPLNNQTVKDGPDWAWLTGPHFALQEARRKMHEAGTPKTTVVPERTDNIGPWVLYHEKRGVYARGLNNVTSGLEEATRWSEIGSFPGFGATDGWHWERYDVMADDGCGCGKDHNDEPSEVEREGGFEEVIEDWGNEPIPDSVKK